VGNYNPKSPHRRLAGHPVEIEASSGNNARELYGKPKRQQQFRNGVQPGNQTKQTQESQEGKNSCVEPLRGDLRPQSPGDKKEDSDACKEQAAR